MRLTPCDPSVIIGVWNQHFAMPNFHLPPFHSVGRWNTQGQLCQERGLLSVADPCTTSVEVNPSVMPHQWEVIIIAARMHHIAPDGHLPQSEGPIIGCVGVDVSYAAPKAQEIINVALHRQYFIDMCLLNPKERSNSIMSKTNTGKTLTSKIRLSRGYVRQG
jgi:hypothetical protein